MELPVQQEPSVCKLHPERKAVAKGMCRRCYSKAYHKQYRSAECQHTDRAGAGYVNGLWVCGSCYIIHLKKTVPGFSERQRANCRAWHRRNKAWTNEYHRRRRKIPLVQRASQTSAMCKKLSAYGLTLADAEQVLDMQNGCGICGTKAPGRAWDIDHDHTTGAFRGLLCGKCNKGLGLLGDTVESIQKALTYLANPVFPIRFSQPIPEEAPQNEQKK